MARKVIAMTAVKQGHNLYRIVTMARKATAMTAAEQGHKLHRIVIVGGGVGGLVTAIHLVRKLRRSGQAEVLLVDRNRAHVWKPMLHTFAAGTSEYAYENVSFIPHAKLTGYKYWPGDFGGLDRKAQTIKLKPTALPAAGEMLPATTIHYDTLILALGSRANDFGTPGVLEHCHFIDDIGQATVFNDLLRSKVVLAAEAGKNLHVVIVGGGATGVELAAELTERMEIVSSYDSDVTRTHLRLTLIETTARVLGSFPEKISHSVEAKLRGLGIDVRTGTKVVGVDAQGVSLDGDRRIEADLVVWAAGVKGPTAMSNLDGVEINRRGQAQVGDTLQTLSDKRIFALGDCSALTGTDVKLLPSTAQVARQQALFLAKSLANHIRSGTSLGHFKYRDMGSLVSLGEYAAYGTLGSYGFLKGAAFKGWLAHMGHMALYRVHQLDVNGPVRGAVIWLAADLCRLVQPRVRTS
jgi:NADH:ubiquinone reductase (H+-translocating)